MSGNIFYDGSGCKQMEPELFTASFAVVEVDDAGRTTVVLAATNRPRLPQTSKPTKHNQRLAAVQLLTGPSALHGDCAPTVGVRSSGARLLATTDEFMTALAVQSSQPLRICGPRMSK